MTWKICSQGRVLESHTSPLAAQRALMILTAHEMKNGRTPDYAIDPPLTVLLPLSELNLPSWALAAMGEWALLKEQEAREAKQIESRIATAWERRARVGWDDTPKDAAEKAATPWPARKWGPER